MKILAYAISRTLLLLLTDFKFRSVMHSFNKRTHTPLSTCSIMYTRSILSTYLYSNIQPTVLYFDVNNLTQLQPVCNKNLTTTNIQFSLTTTKKHRKCLTSPIFLLLSIVREFVAHKIEVFVSTHSIPFIDNLCQRTWRVIGSQTTGYVNKLKPGTTIQQTTHTP